MLGWTGDDERSRLEAPDFLLEDLAPRRILTDSLLIDDARLVWTGDDERLHLEARGYLLANPAPKRILTYSLLIGEAMLVRTGDDERLHLEALAFLLEDLAPKRVLTDSLRDKHRHATLRDSDQGGAYLRGCDHRDHRHRVARRPGRRIPSRM